MKNLVTVATFNFPAEAEAFRLMLEEQGIQTFIADDNLAGMNWLYLNAVGGVKIQVAASDAGRAEKIVKKHQRSKKIQLEKLPTEDITFTCEDCGKIITFPAERRGGVETCPHCGSYVDVPLDNERVLIPESKGSDSVAENLTPNEIQQSEKFDLNPQTNLQLWLEIFAVLCIFFIPNIYSAITSLLIPHSDKVTGAYFIDEQLLTLIQSFRYLLPLLVIIALSKEPWPNFGIVRPKWALDIIGGCAIWACNKSVSIVMHSIIPSSMFAQEIVPHQKPGGIFYFLLLLLALCVNAFAQELAVRGFLLTRLEKLMNSTAGAVVITTILFGSYHAYQGLGPALSVTAAGLVYAISFCMFRRLWPVCIAHAITNIIYFIH